jgi:hypothetical protein
VLSAIVERVETEAPIYVRVPSLDLRNHVDITRTANLSQCQDETRIVEDAIPSILDATWPKAIPPWKLTVLPFLNDGLKNRARCFLAFSFSHSLGDGISGLAFHRSLLDALQEPRKINEEADVLTAPSSSKLFPEPFDTPERLPISWSFFLSPFLSVYLPKFISAALGFRTAVTTITPGTWTATPGFYDTANHHTAVKILEFDASTVSNAVKVCRKHNAKLTALIHQIIIRALSECLPEDMDRDNFVSGTAINMRPAIGVSDNQMGLFVSGYFDVHSCLNTAHANDEELWDNASTMSSALANASVKLQDQPIGLLRYLPSVRSWTLGKLGQKRDSSYEISNLVTFDASPPSAASPGKGASKCTLEKLVFSQPANTVSSPLTFNIVSVKAGSLVCVVSWQIGALGLDEGDEKEFVKRVCEVIDKRLRTLD